MKELNDRIEQLNRYIKQNETALNMYKKELEAINNTKQVSTYDIYNNMDNLISLKSSKGSYEYILGGDGRSKPWSENREGIILNVELNKDYYFLDKHIEAVEEYVKSTCKFDKLVINPRY